MKRAIIIIMVLAIALTIASHPRKTENGQKTQYSYMADKYGDVWELIDSARNLTDTVYIYRLGGQYFVFKANGQLLQNDVLKYKTTK